MTGAEGLWASFPMDPREPAHASLRASDADRDRIASVLGEAYADGRLDREEHGSRAERLAATRTLGELPPLVADLVVTAPGSRAPARLSSAELEERAVAAWRKDRREALWGLISVSAIVWTIWLVGSLGPDGFQPYFPWPVFVTLATALNLGRVQFQRESAIAQERRRLEKKQRKESEKRRGDEQS